MLYAISDAQRDVCLQATRAANSNAPKKPLEAHEKGEKRTRQQGKGAAQVAAAQKKPKTAGGKSKKQT